MYHTGYTTGTFDMTHEGHFRILKCMKTMCDILVVGLTSDSLATKQKRKPILPYECRRSILEHSKYVDLVVPHNGSSKQEVWKKIKFEVLFIGDDYYGCKEYSEFKSCPVIYLPRTPSISTSSLLKAQRVSEQHNTALIFKAIGIQDVIFKMGEIVYKFIRIGSKELGNTADVYNMGFPRPRNWKIKNANHKHPNITGVNNNREIQIQQFLCNEPYNCVKNIRLLWRKTNHDAKCGDEISVHADRKYASALYLIEMIDGGKTLRDWIQDATVLNRRVIRDKIHVIINRLRDLKIVHNDLHSRNVLIDKDLHVRLIDFGWCLHKSFEFTQEEKYHYNQKLTQNFDQKHFYSSLEWDNIEL